jgi:ribosomal protein L31E
MTEKTFTINLRKQFMKKPEYKKTKKAVTAIKEHMFQHLKTEDVKIGPELNLALWNKGNRHPPAKIKVKVVVEENIAYVELPGFPFSKVRAPKEEKKKTDKKEEAKKEQEKELNKEKKKEEILEQKKEHVHHDKIETPQNAIKEEDKVKEAKAKRSRVINETGKK